MQEIAGKDYKILGPTELYEGRSYSDLLSEFWNWIFSIDCDRTNIGDVVFLRGVTFPKDLKELHYRYSNEPVVMIGENKLVISTDQAIFFNCYTTMSESLDQNIPNTSTARRNDVVISLNHAGVPSEEQISIDGSQIVLPSGLKLADFRTVTNDFILNVPDPSSGTTLGPYFETILSPGDHPSVAGGYCLLIQFNTPGTHYIHSIGKGVPWQGGEYVTELFYEIQVIKSTRSHVPLNMVRSFTEGRVQNRIEELMNANQMPVSQSQSKTQRIQNLTTKLIDQSNW
jgi:hypothetical protein